MGNQYFVFDLHNVVFKPNYTKLFSVMLRLPGKIDLLSYFFNPFFLYHALSWARDYGLGQGYLQLLFARYPGLRRHEKSLATLITTQTPINSTVALLHELKAKGYKLYIFSNMGEESCKQFMNNYPDIFVLFDGV